MLAWLLSSTRRRVACCSGWTPCNHSYGCSLDSLAIRLGGPYGRALPAHAPARASAGAPDYRENHVPRDGDDVLAGAGGGGDEWAWMKDSRKYPPSRQHERRESTRRPYNPRVPPLESGFLRCLRHEGAQQRSQSFAATLGTLDRPFVVFTDG